MKPRLILIVLTLTLATAASASGQNGKTLMLLDVQDAAAVKQPKGFNPVLTYNAQLDLVHDDRADRQWVNVSFNKPSEDAKHAFSAVFFENSYEYVIPPFDERRFPDGGPEWPNVWLGYDRLTFDYRNTATEPIRTTVLIQDWISWLPVKYDGLTVANPLEQKQTELPQLYEEEVVLQPGAGTAAIELKKPLWTNNRAKGLGLDNVKAFGLCLKSPAEKVVLGVNRFRLESKDAGAGVFRYPERAKCEACGRATSDRYAPFCPFCGAERKEHAPIPKALPQFGNDVVLVKAIDGGGGGHNNGGGGDVSDKIAGPSGSQAIRHYDVYYNRTKGSTPIPDRKRVQWEYRYQLKFAIGSEFKDKPRIKRATLWLSSALKLKDQPEPVFCQKPWMPGVLAFSINDSYQGWDGKQMTFHTTSPYERLIYVGGQHPSSALQNPQWRVPGHEARTCLPLEITEHVQEAIDGGKETFTIALKAFTPFGAIKDPHSLGHTMNFYALGHEKSAVIAVEMGN
jgi:hypothetical protein